MSKKPNVILLIFDTLRSDYLSCYGADVDTPGFAEVAHSGVCFDWAFGAGPATPISHASLYAGQYPSEHGVTGQYINLPTDVPVLAEWFSSAGYDTYGITGPAKMGSPWGYDRGFDEMYEPYHDRPSIASKEGLLQTLTQSRFRRFVWRKLTRGENDHTRLKFELLRDTIRSGLDDPFFALCNFVTVHAEYDPPRPYKMEATPEFTRPRWSLLEKLLGEHGEIDRSDIRLDRILHVQSGDGVGRFLANPEYLNDAEIALLRKWYAASVEFLDDELQKFLAFYERELQDDTILILTADHGEQLGEHGLWEHSHYLYDETLHVPLIMTGPALPEGSRRTDLVSHVDIFDTLCDLCDIAPPETTSGRSLFRGEQRDAIFMEYGQRDVDDFANDSNHGRYLDGDQLRRFAAGRKGIRSKEYRFEITSRGTEHLYELPSQAEIENPPSAVVDPLRELLITTLGPDFGTWPEGDPDDVGVSDSVQSNLRELGYID